MKNPSIVEKISLILLKVKSVLEYLKNRFFIKIFFTSLLLLFIPVVIYKIKLFFIKKIFFFLFLYIGFKALK
jgi:hypothetical protein